MEKETSSRKRRESDSHRDRESSKDHHHHRSKHDDGRHRSDDHHRRRSDSRAEREGSRDRDVRRDRERSHSLERKRKDRGESEERDRDVRSHSVEKKKRKERGESEERSEKRSRGPHDDNGRDRDRDRDRRRFEENAKDDDEGLGFGGEAANREAKHEPRNGVATRLIVAPLNTYPDNFEAPIDSPATKVSSISKTNENKGNSNRSHEVPGKSSTDGTASDAGTSGGLSRGRDILAKAKITLQKQKELAERMKKLSSLNRGVGLTGEVSQRVCDKGGAKGSSSGILQSPTSAPDSVPTEVMTGMPNPAVPQAGMPHLTGLTAQNVEAVKRAHELAAKMGFWQDPEFATVFNAFPGQMPQDVNIQPKPSKVPVLRLDAMGREIDEEGKVVDVPKAQNLSTLKVNINKQKKDAFRILKPELDVDPDTNPHFDPRVGINKNKLLRTKRPTMLFVEEGKWSKDAETIKLRSQFGEAKAKELKAKQAQLAKAKGEPDINPNLIEVGERVITKEKTKETIPDVEWWDVPFLRSGSYGEISDDGGMDHENFKMDKITIYVEHPRPIEPPAEPAPPPPQPLKLTKKEQKKLRTQRRLAREKDRQEMIRLGVLEPPKAKVKMSNLMKVLGSEATQDPTKLEMEIRSAAAEREQAHIDRNIARKLTPAERREKKERKLFDYTSTPETIVSVYKINDLSHPQARFKVDVNAQENRLSGCVVISEGISVVVVEGGSKSVKRYGKLMLRRIDWSAAIEKEEDEENEEEEKAVNKCVLVWQGSVAKPNFNRFMVQECRSEAAARKFFSDHGVAHYWDLALNFTDDDAF